GAVVSVAIVTGSDSGIGKATAVQLARDGFDVGITWHRDEEGALATADEVRSHGRRAEVRQLDLTELPGAADEIDEFARLLGGIDALVNCAGVNRQAPALEFSFEDWRHTRDGELHRLALLRRRGLDDGRLLRRRRWLPARQPVRAARRVSFARGRGPLRPF